MGIGVVDQAVDGMAHAIHFRFGRPEKPGNGQVGTQRVQILIVRHVLPVDAADILTPPHDLADEPFHRVEGRTSGLVGMDGGIDYLLGS